jgi:hypothetical protein
MDSLILKLLPYSDKGIYYRQEGDTIVIGGLSKDIDLRNLKSELEEEWVNLVRQEAAIIVKRSLLEAQERLRPDNFDDLVVRLQLGRISEEQRQILINYYDQIDELERTAQRLIDTIGTSSVEDINNMDWPNWVTWNRAPTEPNFVLKQGYQ